VILVSKRDEGRFLGRRCSFCFMVPPASRTRHLGGYRHGRYACRKNRASPRCCCCAVLGRKTGRARSVWSNAINMMVGPTRAGTLASSAARNAQDGRHPRQTFRISRGLRHRWPLCSSQPRPWHARWAATKPAGIIGKDRFRCAPPLNTRLAYRADDAEVMASGPAPKRIEEQPTPKQAVRCTWVETIKTTVR